MFNGTPLDSFDNYPPMAVSPAEQMEPVWVRSDMFRYAIVQCIDIYIFLYHPLNTYKLASTISPRPPVSQHCPSAAVPKFRQHHSKTRYSSLPPQFLAICSTPLPTLIFLFSPSALLSQYMLTNPYRSLKSIDPTWTHAKILFFQMHKTI